jgi:hypothetical protein
MLYDCVACVLTTLRNFVACMVLIAPDGACHAFGMLSMSV